MPRGNKNPGAPFAGQRFLSPKGGRKEGKILDLEDVTNSEKLFTIVQDAINAEVAVTLSRTKDGTAICVSFFANGERNPWYISSPEDWTDMALSTSV